MTFRDFLYEMLDCGIDDLDAQIIVFHEENEKGNYVAVQDDFIDVSKNGDALQIFVHTRPFTDV